MNDTRARFEEIWPVPEGVYWDEEDGEYMPREWKGADEYLDIAVTWDARLDTFARCQETTDVYVSLVDEMLKEIELCHEYLDDLGVPSPEYAKDIVCRAKQIMEQKK